MEIFYCKNLVFEAENLLDENESIHLIQVLRKKIGDTIQVTDGKGQLFEAIITKASSKKCSIFTNSLLKKVANEFSYELHMAIAPTKNIDRFEFFVEKATEIGVHSITPLLCEKSERKVINQLRIERIALSAMKQSGSLFLPEIKSLTKFAAFVELHKGKRSLICTCSGERTLLQDTIDLKSNNILLIGPEGDFSAKEIELAKAAGALPISLGDKRMRVETAGIYVASIFNMVHQKNQ
jgi:16S rRNA (uracil1498-N3)-methyltransferase